MPRRCHARNGGWPESSDPWLRANLVHVNHVIGPEFQAQLHKRSEVVDLPFDRLRQGRDAVDMAFEMREPMRLHVPVAAAKPDTERFRHTVLHEALELIAPAAAVLRYRAVEIAKGIADSQQMRVRAVKPHIGKPGSFGAELEAADLPRAIDANTMEYQ